MDVVMKHTHKIISGWSSHEMMSVEFQTGDYSAAHHCITGLQVLDLRSISLTLLSVATLFAATYVAHKNFNWRLNSALASIPACFSLDLKYYYAM